MKKIYIAGILLMCLNLSFTAFSDGKTAVMILSGEDKTAALEGMSTESEQLISSTVPASSASETSEEEPDTGTALNEEVYDVNGLDVGKVDVPDNAEVLIVLGEDASADNGTLSVYTRTVDEDGTEKSAWSFVLSTHAVSGENGLYKSVEGDKKTPVGVFLMNTPFGIMDAQEGFPEGYLKVTEAHYWNGDSESDRYNQLVDINTYSDFDTSRSEHIVDYGDYYNYCIDIGYNPEGTKYLGSAIYLHCHVTGDDDTSGCVAIPEEDMIEIMKLYEEGNTYMAIYDKADMEAVCRAES